MLHTPSSARPIASSLSAPDRDEAVVLLHGIGLDRLSLLPLARKLRQQGYHIISISYPSTRKSIDEIAEWLSVSSLDGACWDKFYKIHFVTHSMGGLVARRYLTKYQDHIAPEKLGRVVMMGPPNQGSEIADFLRKFPPYRWIFGPAGGELSTFVQKGRTEALFYEIGVIAGSSSWLYPISRLLLPRPNDGRVAVESTKLPALTDHITINTSHTFMIYRTDVQRQVINFLKNGAFIHVK